VRHGHRPHSTDGQGEAGTGPGRARPGALSRLRGGDPGVEGAKVARPSARCWGRPPRRAARQGPASAARGARGYTFPSPPALASSRAAAAEISSRGNHADSSRGSSPRPSSPPPPLCWGAGASPRRGGGSGSLGQEVAGGRGAAGYQLALPCDAALRPATPRAPGPRPRSVAPRTMLLPGHARPPPAPQPAQHPGLRRQAEPPGQLLRLFYCTVLVCSKEIAALTDFSELSWLLEKFCLCWFKLWKAVPNSATIKL
uniref:Eva-1 homolog C n=1 Tax=Balaenoptera musculus TaxID=9771 RepID=A0A8C0E361_BALMU